ncbi:MAG TPA: UDP-glucose/GDP-mannose dehydrogenase family protein [Actinomycetota bacterium]|nr:UDP-glucose/GDP-mannose dehydrogenase family protein [Actinomycetota bacterium]
MQIGIIGAGHVGLVSAACFARIGHDVVAVDAVAEKIDGLKRGQMPFFEPDLEDLVQEGVESGRLRFSHDMRDALTEADAVFICVGTPGMPSGEADLSQVEGVAHDLARLLNGRPVVLVEKSTVPATTGRRLSAMLKMLGIKGIDVVSNPEFLREGSAVQDTLEPDRIVIGSESERATELLLDIYRPIIESSGCGVVVTDVQTAELIKHASNAFLATKISFINAVADICEATGADVQTVATGVGLDHRISVDFLQAGIGYGGSCFPKDIAAFIALGQSLGVDVDLLRDVQKINQARPGRLVAKLREQLWHLKGKRIAILGLAFKPGTDDLREAPALVVVEQLLAEGASVVAYDPVAMPAAKEVLHGSVEFADSALDAIDGAHAAVFVTEWPEFAELPPREIASRLRFPIVVDGRNLFDLAAMRDAGLNYTSVGRVPVRTE